jgi:hypothetical protein
VRPPTEFVISHDAAVGGEPWKVHAECDDRKGRSANFTSMVEGPMATVIGMVFVGRLSQPAQRVVLQPTEYVVMSFCTVMMLACKSVN